MLLMITVSNVIWTILLHIGLAAIKSKLYLEKYFSKEEKTEGVWLQNYKYVMSNCVISYTLTAYMLHRIYNKGTNAYLVFGKYSYLVTSFVASLQYVIGHVLIVNIVLMNKVLTWSYTVWLQICFTNLHYENKHSKLSDMFLHYINEVLYTI